MPPSSTAIDSQRSEQGLGNEPVLLFQKGPFCEGIKEPVCKDHMFARSKLQSDLQKQGKVGCGSQHSFQTAASTIKMTGSRGKVDFFNSMRVYNAQALFRQSGVKVSAKRFKETGLHAADLQGARETAARANNVG